MLPACQLIGERKEDGGSKELLLDGIFHLTEGNTNHREGEPFGTALECALV